MTAAEAYHLYRGRDVSEKIFRADKTFLGSRSQRAHSSSSMHAKIFIEFVALIVRNRFYNLLKEQMLRLKTRRNTMTVPGAIRELEKIEMTRRFDSQYLLDFALTKIQKMIFQSFGLSAEAVTAGARSIAAKLAQTKDEKVLDEDAEEKRRKCRDGNRLHRLMPKSATSRTRLPPRRSAMKDSAGEWLESQDASVNLQWGRKSSAR